MKSKHLLFLSMVGREVLEFKRICYTGPEVRLAIVKHEGETVHDGLFPVPVLKRIEWEG